MIMKKISVIGIGNPLKTDDGLGIYLLEKCIERKKEFSERITFIDGGTGGMNLIHTFSDYDIIIIVDAVNFGGQPGEVKWFKPEEVDSTKLSLGFSIHETDFLKIIQLSKSIDKTPKSFFIFGIQPADISPGKWLSKILQQHFDLILDKLVKKITTTDGE